MNPKSSKHKIAFTGTNCSGKTTTALGVTERLKSKYHYLAEVVSSQDRKITWKDEHFPVNPKAHYGMITNLIHAEVQAELKGDADVIITDRSVVDLYAIALTDHPNDSLIKDLGVVVKAWASTYSSIIYLPPLPYQEDGKRPADEFRMRTHATLRNIMGDYSNIIEIPRPSVMDNVKSILGIKEEPSCLGYTLKWESVARKVGLDCPGAVIAVKEGTSSLSDTDVFVMADFLGSTDLVKAYVDHFFGTDYCAKCHFMGFPANGLSLLSEKFGSDITFYSDKETN